LEYDTIYLFTAIGSPHRVLVGEYEGKRPFGITIRYDIYLPQLGFHAGVL